VGLAQQQAAENEINTDGRSNALLTCQFAVFWIVNQKLPKGLFLLLGGSWRSMAACVFLGPKGAGQIGFWELITTK
jgi:hypothetical protein